MKKKILSSLLTFSMVFGLLPMTAFGAQTVEIKDSVMDFREIKNDTSGDGWTWDGEEKILTLKDFKGEVPVGQRQNSAAILLPKDSAVLLEGKNNELISHSYHCNGFYSEGDFSFYGSGKLKVTLDSAGASAVYVKNGSVSFEDSTEITVDSQKHAVYVDGAKAHETAVSVTGDAKVIFPDDLKDDAVFVVVEYGIDPEGIGLDFDEVHDKDEETITLEKATQKPVEKPEEKPIEKPEEKPAIEEHTYKIVIGNKDISKDGAVVYQADVAPYLSNGYTMLPLRALLVVSDPDVTIQWSASAKTATVSYGEKTFTIVANTDVMKKGDETVSMTTPAELTGGRMFVSLRDWMNIMEIPADQVAWNSAEKTVTLTK